MAQISAARAWYDGGRVCECVCHAFIFRAGPGRSANRPIGPAGAVARLGRWVRDWWRGSNSPIRKSACPGERRASLPRRVSAFHSRFPFGKRRGAEARRSQRGNAKSVAFPPETSRRSSRLHGEGVAKCAKLPGLAAAGRRNAKASHFLPKPRLRGDELGEFRQRSDEKGAKTVRK